MTIQSQRNRGKRRPHTPPDVRQEIARMTLVDGLGPSDIFRLLSDDARFSDRVPSLKTINNHRRRLRSPDPDQPWSVFDAEPGEAELVLPVLRKLQNLPSRPGFLMPLEIAHALIAIRRAAPDVPAWSAYHLAVFAVAGLSLQSVHAYLAFAPWRSDENAQAYMGLQAPGVELVFEYEDPDEAYAAEMAQREREARR